MFILDCKEVLANMSCYLDGDGSEELRKTLEQHVAHCRRCRVVFDTTKGMLKLVADVKPFDVPLAASARLYTGLEEALWGQ